MKILAVEFSSDQRSVAVVEHGRVLGCAMEVATRETHALALVTQALTAAGLEREAVECLAIGLGPGSYTGIRAAIALAQGWQLAAGEENLKLLGISSAACLAAEAQARGWFGRVNVVIDAQRGELYFAGYELAGDSTASGAIPSPPSLHDEGVGRGPGRGAAFGRLSQGLRATPAGCRETQPLKLATVDEVRARCAAGEMMIGPEVNRWFAAGRVLHPAAGTLGCLAAGRTDFMRGEQLEPIYMRETTFVKAPPSRIIPA